MEDAILLYKRKFNHALEPLKEMLVHQQTILANKEWLKFVDRTRMSVINQPEQYLGTDLPDKEELTILINGIFQDFLKHHSA